VQVWLGILVEIMVEHASEFGALLGFSPGILGITQRFQPTISRPLFARFAPSFHRSFAVSGFLAPRRRERAKNGVRWAKFGGETAEK